MYASLKSHSIIFQNHDYSTYFYYVALKSVPVPVSQVFIKHFITPNEFTVVHFTTIQSLDTWDICFLQS